MFRALQCVGEKALKENKAVQIESTVTVQRARVLYEQQIKAQREPGNLGKVLVINVDTGAYE